MVRKRPNATFGNPGSPHARGDGPLLHPLLRPVARFSPRPWGWSVGTVRHPLRLAVLPTPVGMVRHPGRLALVPQRSPHARGDGPVSPSSSTPSLWFSPRPWGWSAGLPSSTSPSAVLPTPVGMVRAAGAGAAGRAGSPHARGDGPLAVTSSWGLQTFSPRPWGWSATEQRHDERAKVLPTPVGMVRSSAIPAHIPPSSPHARGDGPSFLHG